MMAPELRTKQLSTEASRRWRATSHNYRRLAHSTNHTRPSDSKIRLAFCWRKKYPSSASYSEFRQKKSLTSVERQASSRLEPRPRRMRRSLFSTRVLMRSSHPASKRVDIVVLSFVPQRIQ